MSEHPAQLARIYRHRFAGAQAYRHRVWQLLINDFFSRWISSQFTVLDLGCGYGEFINNVRARKKFGMDLNPNTRAQLEAGVEFFEQDCAAPWPVRENSLDVVFTSNFFEHLPDKQTLSATLAQARRALKPGGRLIALGPNIKFLPGRYWDFWDHHLPLTEAALSEGLCICGFKIEKCVDRFLPYTMAAGPKYPVVFLKAYLKIRPAWRFFGKQFLIIAQKPAAS